MTCHSRFDDCRKAQTAPARHVPACTGARSALIATALACAATGPAFAQPDARPTEATLGEVTVRDTAERADGPVQGYRASRSSTFTRTDTPLREVPASLTVVPAQVMKDTAMQGMGDVFRYVPGALMHQGEGNRDQIVIRGTSTTADFFVDGIRDDAQVFRDLYNLERVEVLKGPGGMAFGRGGAGGVVNRVVKRPIFGPVGEANFTVGSHSQLRGSVDVGNRLGETGAWRLNAIAETANSFRSGAELKRHAVNPTVAFSINAQTLLTLGYEHLHDTRTADRGFPSFNGAPFAADPATFFGNADQSYARSTVDGLSAVVEHEFAGGWQLKNSLRVTHYDKFYQNVYPGGAVNAAGNMTLSAYNNANLRSNLFNQTDMTKTFSTGAIEHTLLVGAELGRQNSVNKRNTGFFGAATTLTVPAGAPFGVATRFAPNTTDADNGVTADVFALYLQDQVALSRQWKVLAGLRYDSFKVAFDDRRTLVPPVDLARTDKAFSPRAGLVWTPTPAATYYASYSYAFLPSGEQLGLAPTTKDLAPETARNYEVGARWDLLPALTLSGALFRTYRDNVRVTDPANPANFIKTGQQLTDGFEIGLQGDITKNWQVYGGYASLDGRVTKPLNTGTTTGLANIAPAGNKLPLVPNSTLSLWNKFNLGAGWGTGLGVVHQGESFAAIDNTVKLPAFTRIDSAMYYAFADGRTRLALNVENIFNRKYFPTVDGNNNISPGAPIGAKLSLLSAF